MTVTMLVVLIIMLMNPPLLLMKWGSGGRLRCPLHLQPTLTFAVKNTQLLTFFAELINFNCLSTCCIG
jgi:hypothetical protein